LPEVDFPATWNPSVMRFAMTHQKWRDLVPPYGEKYSPVRQAFHPNRKWLAPALPPKDLIPDAEFA
jgi:hypothetical protein